MTIMLTTSGDYEIDETRRHVATTPTTEESFAYRIAIINTWINLLQRQGADLTNYATIFDKLTHSRNLDDDKALYSGVHDAFDFLNKLQRRIQKTPTIPTQVDTDAPKEVAAGTDWAVYGGNIHLTSSTPETGPTQGQLAWKKAIGLACYASPAIDEERVYIPVPGMRNLLSCLNLATGETLWQTRRTWTRNTLGIVNLVPSSYVLPAVASTPIVLKDCVVVNQLGAQGRDLGNKHLLIIDKHNGEVKSQIPAGEADYRIGHAPLAANDTYVVYPTGTQRAQERPPQLIGQNRIICKKIEGGDEVMWDFHIGPTFCEPVVDDNFVYTATADGMVFCLLITGASGKQHFGFSDDRRMVWQFNAGGGVNSALAVTDQHVYFGANNATLYCLNKHSGDLVWRYTTSHHESHSFKLFSTPLITENRVYIGSASRHLYCLNVSTGELLWALMIDDWIRARPYNFDDAILIATMSGVVYCINEDGTIRWQKQVGTHPVYADIVGSGHRALITTSDLKVYCIDIRSGNLLWEHFALDQAIVDGRRYQADELACGGWFQSKPTAVDGIIYIGTPSRFVLALDHNTGEEIWRYEVGGAVSAAPAIADNNVFFGQKGEEFFYCLDAKTGNMIWKQMVGWVWSSANVDSGRVFIPGSDGYVSCLDAENGHIIWRYRTGSSTAPEPPIDGDMVFFGSWDHYVYALNVETGALIWQFYTGGSPDSGAPIAYDNCVYIPVGGNRLFCVDRLTGKTLWEHRVTDGDMNASPALANGHLYISMGLRPGAIPIASRIQCLDAKTGTLKWSHEGGGITGPSVAGNRVYFASTSSPYFYCVNANGNDNGTTDLLWRYEMGERVYESVPALYAGKAYILNENGYLFAFK